MPCAAWWAECCVLRTRRATACASSCCVCLLTTCVALSRRCSATAWRPTPTSRSSQTACWHSHTDHTQHRWGHRRTAQGTIYNIYDFFLSDEISRDFSSFVDVSISSFDVPLFQRWCTYWNDDKCNDRWIMERGYLSPTKMVHYVSSVLPQSHEAGHNVLCRMPIRMWPTEPPVT